MESDKTKRTGPKPLNLQLLVAVKSCIAKYDGNECKISGDMEKLIAGIKKYQLHDYRRNLPEPKTVWKTGTARLFKLDTAKKAQGKKQSGQNKQRVEKPLLLIPSMVNKSVILDLAEDRSMLRWFCGRGGQPPATAPRDTFLLDWGDSVKDPKQQNIDDIIKHRLTPALEYIAATCKSPVHTMGYCMGGVLLAALAHHASEHIATCIYFATPWDFHAGTANNEIRKKIPAMHAMLANSLAYGGRNYLSGEMVQSIFAGIDPEMIVSKFSRFAELDGKKNREDAKKENLFVAVEDWLADSVDIPGKVFECCTNDWYLKNSTAKGEWIVNGIKIDFENIKIPTLIVAAKKDNIVPLESALSLSEKITGAKTMAHDCGHIGLIAGDNAIGNIWRPISEWLAKHDNDSIL